MRCGLLKALCPWQIGCHNKWWNNVDSAGTSPTLDGKVCGVSATGYIFPFVLLRERACVNDWKIYVFSLILRDSFSPFLLSRSLILFVSAHS